MSAAQASSHPAPGAEDAGAERPWRILELFSRNAPLEEILAEIVVLVQERYGIRDCGILTMEGEALQCSAGVRLPQNLLDGLSSLRAGAKVPGCRSEPILSAAGEMLGVVVALPEAGEPAGEAAAAALRLAARIAGMAIEGEHLRADLLYHAHHDSITGLPNRFLLDERLAQAIDAARRSGTGVALLHLGLDRFQTVNDLLGRGIGDLLLEQAARRMEAVLGAEDTLARTAGDEFTAVLPGIAALDDALRSAERMRAQLAAAPFAVGGHELTVTASVGCAIYPEHSTDARSLERCADAAFFRAKQESRNSVRAFAPEEAGNVLHKSRLESALGRALTRGEFHLCYQPQIDLRTMAPSGAEALLRWRHPVIGSVSPATFIPLAEESALIVPIGQWAFLEACRQEAAWLQAGFATRMAVNVSAVQFAHHEYVRSVEMALESSRVPPEAVELELTESALIGDVARVAARMRELKSLGLTLAVDDFGTGYSSLSKLQDLPVDVIKVDVSFVRKIASAEDRSPVIETIVSMARAMGKKLVAEGVETTAQQKYLAALGCDFAQGFLYGRPMMAAEFAAQLRR